MSENEKNEDADVSKLGCAGHGEEPKYQILGCRCGRGKRLAFRPVPAPAHPKGTCWLWDGYISPSGYGRDGKNRRAHRLVYEALVGPIPDGLTIDHLCRVPSCVNPAHLEPVTMEENILRGSGISVKNATKTTCPNGHPYDATYKTKSGTHRRCRPCDNATDRAHYDPAVRRARWTRTKK